MGATGWSYTTPYDPDPEAALQRLRDEVFESGDYMPIGGIVRWPKGQPFLAGLPPRYRLILAALRAASAVSVALHWVARGGYRPKTIDELRALARENGTHSILDIDHTAEFPEPGAATPLSRRKHMDLFGTTTPTRAQYEAVRRQAGDPIGADVRRWEAVYLATYGEDGEPQEFAFVGASGD